MPMPNGRGVRGCGAAVRTKGVGHGGEEVCVGPLRADREHLAGRGEEVRLQQALVLRWTMTLSLWDETIRFSGARVTALRLPSPGLVVPDLGTLTSDCVWQIFSNLMSESKSAQTLDCAHIEHTLGNRRTLGGVSHHEAVLEGR